MDKDYKKSAKSVKVVNNENGGGSGLWQIFKSRTVMIEVYLKLEHDVFVIKKDISVRVPYF